MTDVTGEACWECGGEGDEDDDLASPDAAFFPAIERKGQAWTCPCGEGYRVAASLSNEDGSTILEWEGTT